MLFNRRDHYHIYCLCYILFYFKVYYLKGKKNDNKLEVAEI